MSNLLETELRAHPATPASRVTAVRARLRRPGTNRLALRFEILAPEGAVALPPPVPPVRADRLWETTCFELFLRAPGRPDYLEINVSPSGRWAAYDFCAYRAGMVPAAVAAAPALVLAVEPDRIVADIELSLDLADTPWRAGLCAIVEEAGFGRSYWAIDHAGPEPDFHHAGGAGAELPPPSARASPRA
ncbi:MAG: DOMON-like domain-containing protein [Allosphingosinicella sp.]